MSAYLILTENKSGSFLKEVKAFVSSLDANARIEKVDECIFRHTPNIETIKAIETSISRKGKSTKFKTSVDLISHLKNL